MKNIHYPNLAAEMAREGIGVSGLADVLGVTPKTARDKLNAVYPWSIHEMKKIRDECFPGMTLDYLFSEENEAVKAR